MPTPAPSQYKDYVLVLLFIKCVSDKYAGQAFAPISIPDGASFADMVNLKGKSDIGDQINKKIPHASDGHSRDRAGGQGQPAPAKNGLQMGALNRPPL